VAIQALVLGRLSAVEAIIKVVVAAVAKFAVDI